MKVAAFGGTGRMGKLLVAEAARRGCAAQVLVRDSAKRLSTDGLLATVGDAR